MSKRKGRTARIRKLKQTNAGKKLLLYLAFSLWLRLTTLITKHTHCKPLPNNDDYNILLQWMKKEFNFKSKNLKVASFPQTGRGIAAKKSLSSGDHILSVPRAALIGVNQAIQNSTLLKLLLSYHKQNPNFGITASQALCTFLVEERRKLSLKHQAGRLSNWRPYVKVLPEEFTHPLYWDVTTISMLPDYLQKEIGIVKNKVEDDWSAIRRLMFSSAKSIGLNLKQNFLSKSITYTEYRWAWCCVNTRCVYSDHEKPKYNLILLSESDKFYLAPFLDLLNHATKANVKAGFNMDSQHFEIVTLNKFKKHDQVFIHYGNHSNEKLLLEYGFVSTDEKNENDVVKLSWNEVTMFYDFRIAELTLIQEFLRKRGLYVDFCFGYDGPSWSLIMAVVMLELVKAGMFHQCRSFEFPGIELHPEQFKKMKLQVQASLNDLVTKKLKYIEDQIEKCISTQPISGPDEKSYLEVTAAYFKICKKVLSASATNIATLELSDGDLKCYLK